MNMESFGHLCRICAADTQGRNSVPECVYIFNTPMLPEKIEKHLHLKISEDDALPKVICKSCYRSVEGIVSLSKIAVHTQMVLSNFLKPHSVLIEPDSEFTSIAIACKDYERSTAGGVLTSDSFTSKSTSPSPSKKKQPEEVVVNVSVSDPLTRETQQKIIGASRQRQNVIDPRFVPKSIAHRHVSFASTPKDSSSPEPTNLSISKKNNAVGVINYLNSQPQQQVTVTSGGYVIGQVNTASKGNASNVTTPVNPKRESLQADSEQKRKNLKMTLKNISAVNSGQVSLLKVSQKPSPLVANQQNSNTTPPQMKCQQSRSVSPQILGPPPQAPAPTPTNSLHQRPSSPSPLPRKFRKAPQRRPTIAEMPPAIDALPKEIIIASVKKPKHSQPLQSSSTVRHSSPDAPEATLPKSLFPDELPLGRVIKDFDLLKLIMKALKWPVSKENMDSQMSRLRNSKFTTIMSDPNLLQDTDLTQLLGPYLAPVLLAAQTLQQQQHQQLQQQQQQQQQLAAAMAAAASVSVQEPNSPQEIPTDLSSTTAANLANAIPYRLPPETSVQLVPASPEEERPSPLKQQSHHISRKSSMPIKKPRRLIDSARSRDNSIIISDGEEEAAALSPRNFQRKSGDKFKRGARAQSPIDIDPMLIIQMGQKASARALKQLAERSRAVLEHTQNKRSNSAESSAHASVTYPHFVDDIVLMEPESSTSGHVEKPSKESLPEQVAAIMPSVISMSSPDKLFQARALPPITRPNIKRRKTVIHASPSKSLVSVKKPEQLATSTTTSIATKIEKKSQDEELSNVASSATVSTQVPSIVLSAETKTSNAIKIDENPTPELTTTKTVTKTTTKTESSENKISVSTSMSFFNALSVQKATETQKANETQKSDEDQKPIEAQKVSETTAPPTKEQPRKSLSSKAALAQQLLEAVGLKKTSSSTSEKAGSSGEGGGGGGSSGGGSVISTRESIQQIRSALKRSLKQAQEQNQRKLEEQPVKQDADSTTRGLVKEIKEEVKIKQQASAVTTENVDVEEAIAKVSMIVPKTEKQMSLLKSRSGSTPDLQQKSRGCGGVRKVTIQASVIKKSEEADEEEEEKVKDQLVLKSFSESLIESPIGGNAVSSTSETTQSPESNQLQRRRGRKRKTEEEPGDVIDHSEGKALNRDFKSDPDAESVGGGDSEALKDLEDAGDQADKKNESGSSSSRPSRMSKTMSRYYKGPDKKILTRPTRSTRNK